MLLAAVAALLLFLWSVQRRLVYFPSSWMPSASEVGLPTTEPVTFQTEDGLTLQSWFVPAGPPATGVSVVLFNGNAGNRAMRAPLAAALARSGIAVLMTDYRGYGGNPGSPSEHGLIADARAALRYLQSRPDVDPARIAYFGESLGTGVAVALAVEQRPHALVLRSPFTSLADVGQHHYRWLPVGLLLSDRFDTLDRIGGVTSPTLVIAAAHDSIVPTVLSRRLYDAVAGPRELLVVDDVDHNHEELLWGARVVDAVVRFVTAPPALRRADDQR